MSGTVEGAAKAKKTILARKGKNFYAEIGATGGRVKGVKKGFAANPALAAKAGRRGGAVSRRGKKTV